MPKVTINGTSIEYSEQGQGQPLVLVHGSASDCRTWHRQQETFSKHFHTIAYSRRYHWPNEKIPEGVDYSMKQQVDDLEALLRSLDIAPAHLVGHSYGALLCLLLAIRAPDLIRSLVLAEPPVITLFVSNAPKPSEIIKLLITRPRTAAAILKFGAKGVVPATKAFRKGELELGVRTFGNAVFGPGGYNRLAEPRKTQVRDNLTNVKAELLGSGHMPLKEDQVRNINLPTLLISAQQSVALFHRLTDRLEELMPHAHRVEIPEATHAMHEDNAPAYNAAVLEFLGNRR